MWIIQTRPDNKFAEALTLSFACQVINNWLQICPCNPGSVDTGAVVKLTGVAQGIPQETVSLATKLLLELCPGLWQSCSKPDVVQGHTPDDLDQLVSTEIIL